MTASIDWSDTAIIRLRTLWDEGHSTAEIGRRMGVTKNAIVGKAHRLGLPGRPSPIKAGTPRPPRTPKTTLPVLTTAAAAVPQPPAPVRVPAPPPPPPVRAYRGPSGQPCCWPLGEPGRPGFRFCESGTAPGKPYCPDHVKDAYVPQTDRNRPDGARITRLIRTLTRPA